MNNKTEFNAEQIIAAKSKRDYIIEFGDPAQKSIYMAGEIVMWDDLQSELSQQKELVEEKERENLLYFKTFEAIRDFFREQNIKMNANDPDTLLTHFVLKGQDYLNENTTLKQEIEGLKKSVELGERMNQVAHEFANEQSIRIKELEEGLRQIIKDDSFILAMDTAKKLLSTPTTEPKEGGKDEGN